MSFADFWSDHKKADELLKELGNLNKILEKYDELERYLFLLGKDFKETGFFEAKRLLRSLELETLFSGRYDKQPAVISIYPGAGGEDAADWARMLFEMFQKYAERRKWKTAVLENESNRRTLDIRGDYAYGYLKKESGVHRLVRISPFSAKKLRHTAFALVEVVPDLPAMEESKFVIPEKDLKVEFFRSGGPGGQNVNKVETAVRVIHIPTGMAASSQAERSQAQNREKALKLLKAKIFQLMEKEQVSEIGNLRVKVKPEWGNQIRSYVLNPYQMVKDHRTGAETGRVDEVLNGDLDMFIEAEVELTS